ncbi:hypothetical protein FRC09_006043 [Ceratobasidium sp. 395]|nr:hypothetical protein FRC09_006043 [Ceratobasidium sp. 395]
MLLWCPGHQGITGSKEADKEARAVAAGKRYPQDLVPPFFDDYHLVITRHTAKIILKETNRDFALGNWADSTRARRLLDFYPRLDPSNFLASVDRLPRSHATMLFRLITGHIQLQRHLYGIHAVDSLICEGCGGAPETVAHFILQCLNDMSDKQKGRLKHNFERGLKRVKLFFSSPSDPGPSTQSTQQVDTTSTHSTDPEPILSAVEPLPPPPGVPQLTAESYDNARHRPASGIPAPQTSGQSAKHKRWDDFKAVASILRQGLDSFGPLKQVVDTIATSAEIIETVDKNRTEYESLRKDLNVLFHDLAEFFDASTPPTMAPTIINFAKGIDQELEAVRVKLSETRIGTYETDADKILEHHRRIQALLQRLTESRLKSLPHSTAAKYNSAESSDLRGRCTRNTRVQLLEDIYEWACNDKSQKIYWLNGMAGTGKTTIAYSFCEWLDRSKKLAASFFCSRQLPSCRDVNRIVPTVSHQLSRFSRPFRSALSQVLEDDPEAYNQVLLEQFESLILNPIEDIKVALRTDLVIVIDALDECDNNDGVDRMLSALLSHAQQLPMKFFVASRPDGKILDRMRGQHGGSMPTELRLHELGRPTVQGDIKTYLEAQLISRVNISAANLNTLVQRSGVLFIYASTVVRYLECDNFSRAEDRLEDILEASRDSSNDSEKDINNLYAIILEAALNNPKLTSRDKTEMKLVLDTVICAQVPLSVDVMAGLLGLSARKVRAALRPLYSVLHLSEMTAHRITTLHESFPDYMLDRNRSNMFHCDANKRHTYLAQLCFKHIKLVNPPFNICNLESSYVLDEDVQNLPTRVEKSISKQLLYACRYWVAHYMSAEGSQDLDFVSMLREFASERFLLWMEVMNLSGKIEEGVSTLLQVQEWSSSVSRLDEGIKSFLQDMWKFADSFASTGARLSTPHIYVSALTFWPEHTPISDHYHQHQGCRITERSTAMRLREPTPTPTTDSKGRIHCISCSPDGAYIVAGSKNGTIRIWDARTGQPVGQPMLGHIDEVCSVAYSPDAACIVSGSFDCTIRIWDAHTSQPVGQPLWGHTFYVASVAYSPDGAYIASGSGDKTIQIWDAHTGRSVGGPLKGHNYSIKSVAYSPDGAYIVSGSVDGAIRIWDTYTRQPVGQPLWEHTFHVASITYSPNGAYIASGSGDCTIRIWDAHTRQPVGQPLQGHTDEVCSVAYSPDGTYIISGSDDNTIRIWDTRTCQPVGQPLLGHAKTVCSVACSSDGEYIASGYDNNTICVWDMKRTLLMNGASEIDNGQPQLAHSLHAISEPRILCNLGCQIDCPHMAWTSNRDGWIVFNDNKLVWVPPDLEKVALLPQNTALISPRGFLQLDLDRNKLGAYWHKYFQPEKSIEL